MVMALNDNPKNKTDIHESRVKSINQQNVLITAPPSPLHTLFERESITFAQLRRGWEEKKKVVTLQWKNLAASISTKLVKADVIRGQA